MRVSEDKTLLYYVSLWEEILLIKVMSQKLEETEFCVSLKNFPSPSWAESEPKVSPPVV